MTPAAAPTPRQEAAALLGVPIDASASEVQHAYLRAARRTHPDVVPEADPAERRAAAAAFDRLTRARDALLAPAEPDRQGSPARPAAPPVARRAARPGLGGSLVLLALLAFLLIGIVSAEQALRIGPYGGPGGATTGAVTTVP